MVNAMKTANTTGLSEKAQVFVPTATETSILRALGEGAPQGIMGSSDYLFNASDSPANRKFVKAYEAAYGAPPGFPAFHGYITALFIAEAYKKAGSVNKEKFVDALSGLKIDSPTGELEMRACDHQVVLPIYLGITKKSTDFPQYDFVMATNIEKMTGDDVMPSCDEIMKARGK